MRKRRRKIKKEQIPLSGVSIPRMPLGPTMIVSNTGSCARVIQGKKKYNRKRIERRIKLWDDE